MAAVKKELKVKLEDEETEAGDPPWYAAVKAELSSAGGSTSMIDDKGGTQDYACICVQRWRLQPPSFCA